MISLGAKLQVQHLCHGQLGKFWYLGRLDHYQHCIVVCMCFDSSHVRLSIYHPRKNPGDFQEYSSNLTSVRMINCEVGMERLKTVNAKTSRPQMGEGCP